MKKIILFTLFVFAGIAVYAQLQDRIWIFGRPISGSTNATFYFGNPPTNPITTLPCGQPNQITVDNGVDIWTIVTNPSSGSLIFYTDGKNVYDNLHNMVDIDPLVPGFEPLGGSYSSSQPAAVTTVPGSIAAQFYIFSNPTGAGALSYTIGPISYRLYNALTNTFGQTQYLPGPYGATDVSEGMKIIQSDTDPNVLWLVTSLFPSVGNETRYVIYKINNALITYQGYVDMGPDKHPVGGGPSPILNIITTKAGTINGVTQVAFSLQYTSSVYTCQFDNINGQFITSSLKEYYTGYSGSIPTIDMCEFSPNGRFLYFTIYYLTSNTNGLYQIDLLDPILSAVQVHSFSERYAGGLELGPDSLIYHVQDGGNFTNAVHVGRVLQPDVEYIPGVTNFSLFYEENYATFNNVLGYGFCDFLFISKDVIVGLPNPMNAENSIDALVFPNPANDIINIDLNQTSQLELLNFQGIVMRKLEGDNLTSINIADLSPGIYFVRINSKNGDLVKKFIKK